MNTNAQEEIKRWVLAWQRKLHRWTMNDKDKKHKDLFNLVYDPRTLQEAWNHVKANKGSRTAGMDGQTRRSIESGLGVEKFLEYLHKELKRGTYLPQPVIEKLIPKPGGKFRRLGIPTLKDRVVQQALRMVLEPIFEADFYVSSYAYRPGRRAQDAIQNIFHFIRPCVGYTWAVEGDIRGCFDNVHHGVLMEEIRKRITDKKILRIIRIILKAGVMTELGVYQRTITGTPQGGILSPLLANIYLSRLDQYFNQKWKRYCSSSNRCRLRKKGLATCYLIRFADDFVILVKGTQEQANSLKEEAAQYLKEDLKMELSWEKTRVTSVKEGFDFLGFRMVLKENHRGQIGVRVYPSKKSLKSVQKKIKEITSIATTNLSLTDTLVELNRVLRGWTNYFRFAHSKKTFSYLDHYSWRRVYRWMRKKHRRLAAKTLVQRYCPDWNFREGEFVRFNPSKVKVERYGYRGNRIPTPWNQGGINPQRGRRGDRLPVWESPYLESLESCCAPVKVSGEPDA